MLVRSLLRRAGVFVLASAGCAALASGPASAVASYNGFAGKYLALGGDHGAPAPFVSATTTFVVPSVKCARTDQAIAPSVTAADLPASGALAATLFVGCHGGKAHYWPELTVNGHSKDYRTKSAHAGDTIVLWLDDKGGHVSVTDETRKFKVSRAGRGGRARWVFIGDEGWTTGHDRLQRVANFGTLTYFNIEVARRTLVHRAGTLNRTSAKTLQIETGPLFHRGTAFRTYFKHS